MRGEATSRVSVVREKRATQVEHAFVDIPGRYERLERHKSSDLQPIHLPSGSTIWAITTPFGYQPGTVKARQDDGTYLVQFLLGNRDALVPLSEPQFVVRDGSDFHHSVDALAVGLVDHAQSYRARIYALRSFVRQRAACRGFTAAISAATRPFRHQVNVLAQVMSDTVRRYVLADEVGLGKTIEAGLIIRQVLLDDPRARVLVSVPPMLIGQWQDELTYKLLLGRHFQSRWAVVAHDDLSFAAIQAYDLVVVDEAHRVAEAAIASDAEADIVESVAATTPALLLLTATPIRGNAEVFHYLLHLIDPIAHPKSDIDGFRTRLALREQLAQSIELLIDPAIPWELVDDALSEFADTYPDDLELQGLLHEARSSGGEGARNAVIEVGDYLRETYRLSRRVIRNRRSALPEFPTTGRRFEDLKVDDPAMPVIERFLERWRDAVAGKPDAVDMFSYVLDAALAGPQAVMPLLTQLRVSDLDDDQRYAIDTLLAELEHAGTHARLDAAIRWLADGWARGTEQVVVATSYESVARALASALAARIGPKSLRAHLESMDRTDADAAVREFLEADQVRILIVDQSAEEGRNLQEADQLLHLDIPLSINRLEQRVGRVDRFGAAAAEDRKRNVALTSGSVWECARDRLHELVGVRRRSVATLQRPLAELEQELAARVVTDGPSAVDSVQDGLVTRLEEEQGEIDRLEELEAYAGRDGFNTIQFERLEQLEEDWGDLQQAVDRLTNRDFGLHLRRRMIDARPGVFEYTTPGGDALPKIPRDRLEELAPLLRGYRTFSRPIAERNPGVQLVRMGDPMVDWLESLVRTDERGRARAIIRHCPGIAVPELWFQFDLLLEANLPSNGDALAFPLRTLRRMSDGYLPPITLKLWSNGQHPPDQDFKATVLTSMPSGSSGDREIYGDRWTDVLNWFPEFPFTVDAAWQEVATRVQADDRTKAATLTALERLQVEFVSRVRTLERVRSVAGPRAALVSDELTRLTETTEHLLVGIKEPALRCTAVGAYVLTGTVAQ